MPGSTSGEHFEQGRQGSSAADGSDGALPAIQSILVPSQVCLHLPTLGLTCTFFDELRGRLTLAFPSCKPANFMDQEAGRQDFGLMA